MNATDLAWAAGIMEGEGSVRINTATGRTLGTLTVSVTSTDPDMLTPLLEAWGGSLRSASTRPECKPAQRWTLASRRAVEFLQAIEPYCRVARFRAKLTLALEFQAQKQMGNAARTDEYREQQWIYYMRMKDLNVRGAA